MSSTMQNKAPHIMLNYPINEKKKKSNECDLQFAST